jgi:hypothetical protein
MKQKTKPIGLDLLEGPLAGKKSTEHYLPGLLVCSSVLASNDETTVRANDELDDIGGDDANAGGEGQGGEDHQGGEGPGDIGGQGDDDEDDHNSNDDGNQEGGNHEDDEEEDDEDDDEEEEDEPLDDLLGIDDDDWWDMSLAEMHWINSWPEFPNNNPFADDHITYDLPRRYPDSDSEFSFANDNGYLEDDEMYLARMQRKRLRREARGEPAERNPAASLVSHDFINQQDTIHNSQGAVANDAGVENDGAVEDHQGQQVIPENAVPQNNQLPPPVDVDEDFVPHGEGQEGVWWWAFI